ncbi:MAG: hypothetical protein S4CHLAM20_14010 [Chlamydiia bacterium]|nr:hypothetical protein [Chlamydiia bacterium]
MAATNIRPNTIQTEAPPSSRSNQQSIRSHSEIRRDKGIAIAKVSMVIAAVLLIVGFITLFFRPDIGAYCIGLGVGAAVISLIALANARLIKI